MALNTIKLQLIDKYFRRRILSSLDKKSVTNTSRFLVDLEACMGFKIHSIQTDNGRELAILYLRLPHILCYTNRV